MDGVGFENTNEPPEPLYFGPAQLNYRQYQIGVEKIRHTVRELEPLVQRHWDELHPAPGDLLVDWSTLIGMEHAGRAILVTARGGALAGYFIGTVGEPLFQSNRMVLTEIGFFVDRWARTGQLGKAILAYSECLAGYLGFHRLEIFGLRLPDGRSPDALYRRAGYQPVAVQYQKELA
jgi:hypothetical protein